MRSRVCPLVASLCVSLFLASCVPITSGDQTLLASVPMGVNVSPPLRPFPVASKFPLKIAYDSWGNINTAAGVYRVDDAVERLKTYFQTEGDYPIADLRVVIRRVKSSHGMSIEGPGTGLSAMRLETGWDITLAVTDWDDRTRAAFEVAASGEAVATKKHEVGKDSDTEQFVRGAPDRALRNVLAELIAKLDARRGDLEALNSRYTAFRAKASAPASVPASGRAAPSARTASGFVLRNTNLVLTNYHVVRDQQQISLNLPNGQSYPGRIVATDPSRDLALIEAVGRPASAGGLALALGTPIRSGETVHAIGYPLGGSLSRRPSIVSGQVSSTVGVGDDISQFRTTAPINPGNSGGPILNQNGQVVGIAASGLVRTDVEAIRFGIKASAAALMLQQVVVASPFDVAVTPTGSLPTEKIFEQSAPFVVLIEVQ